ncbi:MAG: peptidase [Hyphomonadaceae bacterium]|nr:peptidase [Hyphomonadaceae bacterium]
MGEHRASFVLAWAFALCVGLAACGGGGGGSAPAQPPAGTSPPPPPPPPATGANPTWTANVFAASSTYQDRCQTVRTGRDIEGNAFPDQAGSTLIENFWLRSWTNETYLWNTEVTDRDPGGYSSRLDYFAVLKTTARTNSGKDKDQFHFSQTTEEYLRQRNSAPSPGYGAYYTALSNSVPRDYRIQYTEPNSPASQLVRGSKILSVDGADLVNATSQSAINTLNAGLFPSAVGQSHVFVVQEPSGTQRTVTLVSANVSEKPVNRTQVLSTPSGPVGYVFLTTFSPFSSEREIAETITQMKGAGVRDLVLDLRYNGGGLLAVASQLSYAIAGAARTGGRTFERLEFNAAAGSRNPVTGEANTPQPFQSTGLGFSLTNGTRLDTLDLGRVYILSTADTCSASESVINALRGIDVDVVLIGGATCGKPYGFYPTDNCGQTYYSIQFRGVNNKGFGDYADGFIAQNSGAAFGVRIPGCDVPDDLLRELGNASEGLLAAALQYRETGTCPALVRTQAAPLAIGAEAAGVRTSRFSPATALMRSSRDMRMPRR